MSVRIAISLFCLLLVAPVALSQTAEGSLPPEARKRLDSLVGKWTSKWEYLDENGEVVATSTGTEVGRYAQGDWLVEWTTEITNANGVKRVSKAWWFFNQQDKKIYLNSVSQTGELWILSGDPVEFTITSWAKKRADGSEIIIRFRHDESDKPVLRAVMEFSLDGGTTWKRGFRQVMTPAT